MFSSEKPNGAIALPTDSSLPGAVQPKKSWYNFSKSQCLLLVIAFYAIGLMGYDSYTRIPGTTIGKGGEGLCPSQPKAVGKGPGFVSPLVQTGKVC